MYSEQTGMYYLPREKAKEQDWRTVSKRHDCPLCAAGVPKSVVMPVKVDDEWRMMCMSTQLYEKILESYNAAKEVPEVQTGSV